MYNSKLISIVVICMFFTQLFLLPECISEKVVLSDTHENIGSEITQSSISDTNSNDDALVFKPLRDVPARVQNSKKLSTAIPSYISSDKTAYPPQSNTDIETAVHGNYTIEIDKTIQVTHTSSVEFEDKAKKNHKTDFLYSCSDRNDSYRPLSQGGPDEFGYVWLDSKMPEPKIAYSWLDGITNGTIIGSGDDYLFSPINIGFTFTYYGIQKNHVMVCTNGWLTFDLSTTTNTFFNSRIPSRNAPNDLIAPLWYDLVVDVDSELCYKLINDDDIQKFVITWNNTRIFGTNIRLTFEVILTSDNEILFQYKTLGGYKGEYGTVGIEDQNGTDGLEYSYNSPILENELAVKFYQPDVGVSFTSKKYGVFALPGEDAVCNITIRNIGTAGADTFDIEVYYGNWSINLYDTYGNLLTDTDSDGIIDTGSVSAGSSVTIVLCVTIPVTAVNRQKDTFVLVASSSVNTSARAQTTASAIAYIPGEYYRSVYISHLIEYMPSYIDSTLLYNTIRWVSKIPYPSLINVTVIKSWGSHFGVEDWRNWANQYSDIQISFIDEELITLTELVFSCADVIVISNAFDNGLETGFNMEYSDAEITAIRRYANDGHGLIATAGTLYAPNNVKLTPLFGLKQKHCKWAERAYHWHNIKYHEITHNIPYIYTTGNGYTATGIELDGAIPIGELEGVYGAYTTIYDTQRYYVSFVQLPSWQKGWGTPGSSVWYNLSIENRAYTGFDAFDLTYISVQTWDVEFYSLNYTLLQDTNGNGIVDTGIVYASTAIQIYIKVDIPITARNETDYIRIVATSMNDDTNTDTVTLEVRSYLPVQGDYKAVYISYLVEAAPTSNDEKLLLNALAWITNNKPIINITIIRSWGSVYGQDDWLYFESAYPNLRFTYHTKTITYADLVLASTDVTIISNAWEDGRYFANYELSDTEIADLERYCKEGHALLATGGTFGSDAPNNRNLASLFGCTARSGVWGVTCEYEFVDIDTHPVMSNLPSKWRVGSTIALTGMQIDTKKWAYIIGHTDADDIPSSLTVAFNTFQPAYGVIVTPYSQYGFGSAGEDVTYTITVHNVGRYPESFSLNAFSNWNVCFYDMNWTEITVTQQIPSLGMENIYVNITIPAVTVRVHDCATILVSSVNEPNANSTILLNTTVYIRKQYLNYRAVYISHLPEYLSTLHDWRLLYNAVNWSANVTDNTINVVIIRSFGTAYPEYTFEPWKNWVNSQQFTKKVSVKYVDKKPLKFSDFVVHNADVLIISDAWSADEGWEYSDAEIDAISKYIKDGFGIVATAGSLDTQYAPNNIKLSTLFGINGNPVWNGNPIVNVTIDNLTHPVAHNLPYSWIPGFTDTTQRFMTLAGAIQIGHVEPYSDALITAYQSYPPKWGVEAQPTISKKYSSAGTSVYHEFCIKNIGTGGTVTYELNCTSNWYVEFKFSNLTRIPDRNGDGNADFDLQPFEEITVIADVIIPAGATHLDLDIAIVIVNDIVHSVNTSVSLYTICYEVITNIYRAVYIPYLIENSIVQYDLNLLYNAITYAANKSGMKNLVVIKSWGAVYGQTVWTNWAALYPDINISFLSNDPIKYTDLVFSKADVVIISHAWEDGRYFANYEFSDAEIADILKYCYEGHGIVATGRSFSADAPNNMNLAPIFGLVPQTGSDQTCTQISIDMNLHEIARNLPEQWFIDEYASLAMGGIEIESTKWAVQVAHLDAPTAAVLLCAFESSQQPYYVYATPKKQSVYGHECETITAELWIKNLGKYTDRYALSVQSTLPPTWLVTFYDEHWLQITETEQLSPLADIKIYVNISIPAGTQHTAVSIQLNITSKHGYVYDIVYIDVTVFTPLKRPYRAVYIPYMPELSSTFDDLLILYNAVVWAANITDSTQINVCVLRSLGTAYRDITIQPWVDWVNSMNFEYTINVSYLSHKPLEFSDFVINNADVLFISDAWSAKAGWEYSDAEINAISKYIKDGFGIVATAGSLDIQYAPNNIKLSTLFGINGYPVWNGNPVVCVVIDNLTHPVAHNLSTSWIPGFTDTTQRGMVTVDALQIGHVEPYDDSIITVYDDAPSLTKPEIIDTYPSDGAVNIPVDTKITIQFSKPMNTQFTQNAFSISPAVKGSFSWTDTYTTLVFTPEPDVLADLTEYTIVVSTRAQDIFGNCLYQPCIFSFITADVTPPDVIAYSPSGINNPPTTTIRVTFSEFMCHPLAESAFSTIPNTTGRFEWYENTMCFIPATPLHSTAYTVIINTTAADISGNRLQTEFIWQFGVEDSIPPYVVKYAPTGRNVSVTTDIIIEFNETMHRMNVEDAFNITPYAPGCFMWNSLSTILKYRLSVPLKGETKYFVTLSENATDYAGNKLKAPVEWYFETEDITPPYVVEYAPTGIGIGLNSTINLTFSEAMNTTSVQNAFKIQPYCDVEFNWLSDKKVIVKPSELRDFTEYNITLLATASDLANNMIGVNTSWQFITADVTKPEIIHTPLYNWYAKKPIPINASITDNNQVAYAHIYYRICGSANFTVLEMNTTDSFYNATIPAEDVMPYGIEYYIEACDIPFPSANKKFLPECAPEVLFRINITDKEAPVIIHTPVKTAFENTAIQLNATVTDNTGVKKVILYYRLKPHTEFINVEMHAKDTNIYKATIPAEKVKGTIEYYIEATDIANNSATSPEKAPELLYKITVITEFPIWIVIVAVAVVAAAAIAVYVIFVYYPRLRIYKKKKKKEKVKKGK